MRAGTPSTRATTAPTQPTPRRKPGRPRNRGICKAMVVHAREAAGLSPEALAVRMGEAGHKVTGRAVYKWERGEARPSEQALVVLCAVLELDIRAVLLED